MSGREIKEGALYRHYRGGLYRVLRIALATEVKQISSSQDIDDSVKLVIYENVEPQSSLGHVTWARPYMMFNEMMIIDGVEKYRFVEENVQHLCAQVKL